MTPSPGLRVLVTGGSGASGIATARALNDSGFAVFTAGSDKGRIEAAAALAGPGVTPLVCDLASLADVRAMHGSLTEAAGAMDGVIHLVGGWRGSAGITEQSDEDWDFLERGAITTLRNVTRVFYKDLEASGTGRFAMVSSTAVSAPTAGGASYVAAKAAAEAWTMAVADGFRSAPTEASGSGRAGHGPSAYGQGASDQGSAAVVLVVKALVDADMRRQHPERTFPGHTDVEDLAAAVVGLFGRPATELNGLRLPLTH
ncbi:SDR family oxidoreductase [Pseudarthrobacter sp. N5]|uniref:SDR family oxidoreductase n=1 Tax=Pseudarthrobacter sp. N5 TaxID=3418416 RepID=UPI003CEAB0A7